MSKDKKLVDVADKAVESLANGGERLADAVEKIGQVVAESSPQVWAKLVQWHRVDALGELIVFGVQILGCLAFSWIFWNVYQYGGLKKQAAFEFRTDANKQYEDSEEEAARPGRWCFYERSKAEQLHHEKLMLAKGANENGDYYRFWGLIGIAVAALVSTLVSATLPRRMANYAVPEKAAAVELIRVSRGTK